jgi:uncharacterized protein (TIGR00369 family)
MRLDQDSLIESVEPGHLVSSWRPKQHFTVLDGYLMGGVIPAVADNHQSLTMFSSHDALEQWVTMDLHTRFLRPIRGGDEIVIESRVITKGKTSAVIETTFMLPGGRLAAIVTGGWRKVEGGRGVPDPTNEPG